MISSEEIEANLFALELLMPEDLLTKELLRLWPERTINMYQYPCPLIVLARIFEVSPMAMAVRMSQLGLLNVKPQAL